MAFQGKFGCVAGRDDSSSENVLLRMYEHANCSLGFGNTVHCKMSGLRLKQLYFACFLK